MPLANKSPLNASRVQVDVWHDTPFRRLFVHLKHIDVIDSFKSSHMQLECASIRKRD